MNNAVPIVDGGYSGATMPAYRIIVTFQAPHLTVGLLGWLLRVYRDLGDLADVEDLRIRFERDDGLGEGGVSHASWHSPQSN
jgi:hypothetical protein